MRYQTIELRYINERLQIGIAGLKEMYLLAPSLMLLRPKVYRERLVYRPKGLVKRIPYSQFKR